MAIRTDLLAAIRLALSCRGLTPESLAAMQCEALQRLVPHAYEAVPYYRRLLDAAGVAPRSIRSPSDLAAVPISCRDDLRGLPVEEVIARGLRADRLASSRTSGISGAPFIVRSTGFEKRALLMSWARALRHFGATAWDRVATLAYIPPGHAGYRCARRPRLRNALGLCPRLTVDIGLQPAEILEALRPYRPDLVCGYPGALSRVAELVAGRVRDLIRPKAVVVGGEVAAPDVRRRIAEGFRAPVYTCYASEEFKLIAWECRETGQLHVYADNLILEVLKDGRPAAPGERGEVVVTNLRAFAMPFIRYRLGDIVTQGSATCACGEPFPTIADVQGRLLDYFTLPDGRLVHAYDLTGVLLETTDWIRYHELVQERTDLITLRVIPYGDPPPDAYRRLEAAMAPVLGPGVTFRVVRVSEIKPDPSGKFRYARSLVTPQPR